MEAPAGGIVESFHNKAKLTTRKAFGFRMILPANGGSPARQRKSLNIKPLGHRPFRK
jgi:hypothetical protein